MICIKQNFSHDIINFYQKYNYSNCNFCHIWNYIYVFNKKNLPNKEKTNLDRIIGMKGIVTEDITKYKPGEVKVDGKKWSETAKENIKKDSIVKILEINSTKLIVERMEE